VSSDSQSQPPQSSSSSSGSVVMYQSSVIGRPTPLPSNILGDPNQSTNEPSPPPALNQGPDLGEWSDDTGSEYDY